MNREEKSYRGCFWMIVVGILLSVATNVYFMCRNEPQQSVVVEHDTVWRDKIIVKPDPTEAKETGETIYVSVRPSPVGGDTHGGSPSVSSGADTAGTVPSVSQQIALPVEQKRYDDSLYTAWVSGYRPSLDSIEIRVPEVTRTVTKAVVKTAPRVSVGVQVGGGVGVFSRQPDVYVGVGVQWRLWP